jgi:F-type H+-transporting ATPase subunit epsilon
MVPGRLLFRILTPAREVLAREVDAASLVAEGGEVGILPGHAPLLARLRPGEASFRDGSTTEWFALSDGFLEVNANVVTALVRTAEPAEEIDVARAEKRRAERDAELKRPGLDPDAASRAELSRAKQDARLLASRRRSAQS